MNAPTLFDGRGKAILVAGGAAGIGKAIVEMALLSGANVVGTDLIAVPEAESLTWVTCDISEEPAAARVVSRGIEKFGRLDAVVNCVGVAAGGPIIGTNTNDWERIMRINVTSSVHLAKASHEWLRKARGSFVLFSSTSGRNGGTTGSGPVYAASKGAVINLSRYLAKEWAEDGIRVNTIAPGPVRTGPTEMVSEDRKRGYLASMLTHRFIEPDEVAAGTLFLLSDHALSMTGTILNISGGLYLD
jgi:3-oxoacyl-[acyl-carrier protein] reductase